MLKVDKPSLIASLGILRAALESEPSSLRLMQQPGANLGEPTKTAARALQEGLDPAGYGA